MRFLKKLNYFIVSSLFNFYFYSDRKKRFRLYFNFKGKYTFFDNSKSNKNLVIVVAGYKDYLWESVFGRLAKFAPKDYDVCIVVPGKKEQKLLEICKQNRWSCLNTKDNKLSLAQNLAIRKHPKAQNIFKLDEDIIIGEGFFERMLLLNSKVEEDKVYDLGFIAPLLNVNGYSYRILLDKLNKTEEYKTIFNDTKSSCMNTNAWHNPESAKYLWEVILPFDETSKKLFNTEPSYSVCPHRFSIGCIFLKRNFWEEMGGFSVSTSGILGVEETDICAYCMDTSKVIVVSHDILAGHFSFGPQTDAMKKMLEENPKMLSI